MKKNLSIAIISVMTIAVLTSARQNQAFAIEKGKSAQLSPEKAPAITFQTFLIRVSNPALYQQTPPMESIEKMTILKLASLLTDPNQAQIIASTKTTSYNLRPAQYNFTDRVDQSIKKDVTGRDFQPYVLTDYQWVENSVKMEIKSILLNGKDIDFYLNYKARNGLPTSELDKKNFGEFIKELSLEISQPIVLKPNTSKIISVTASKDNTLFLIMKATVEDEK